MFECKNTICYENANTIDKHTSYPESNVFTIWLMGTVLSHDVEAAAEDEECMKKSIEQPPGEEEGREASSFNTNSEQKWVSHEISLELFFG